MSNGDEEVKLSLKVMINKENNKVLFAEADSDFADVLVSFLTLPLGKIVPLMKNHYGDDEAPDIEKLKTLYKGLSKLDGAHFLTEGGKQMLLDPPSSFSDECSKLKMNIDDTKPATKYFRCGNVECSRKMGAPLISMYHDSLKCDCGEYMNKPMGITGPGIQDDGGGVFMKKGLSFLITDDFKMVPVVPDSFIHTLVNLGVTNIDGAQLHTVSFGLNKTKDLLMASLLSSTPLTDVVFHRKSFKMEGKQGDFLCLPTMEEESLSDYKKMIVKGWVHTSDFTHMFFLETGGDFVDFLLSLLVIPLCGVEWLLGRNSGLRNMNNLYRSIRDCVDEKCFTMPGMKSRLMKPKLPPGCLSRNLQMFDLEEEVNPKVCFFESVATGDHNTTKETCSWMHFEDPKGGACYVNSTKTFFIVFLFDLFVFLDCEETKNLLICPERKELELHIGLEEALNILYASLTSTSCFANLISEKLKSKN